MQLTTEYPPSFILLCLLLGVLVTWVLYQKSRERYEWNKGLIALLSVARGLVVAMLAFFLIGPLLRYMQEEVQKPIIVLAHDGSASLTAAADSAEVKTKLFEGLRLLQDELSDRYELRTFTYGDRVREGLEQAQDDKQTDLGELFQEVRDRYDGLNLGAVILDSDGIYNRGRDPLYASESAGVPVYTIALGDTSIRTDLLLSDVDHNRITYKGNEFPLVVRFKADHLNGESTRVSVWEDGKELVQQEVLLKGDPAVGEVPLLVRASEAGIRRYEVRLQEMDGEVNVSNNATAIFIEVLDDRQKVLLLAKAPHPDIAAIADALKSNENYEVIRMLENDRTHKPEDFDLIILHQLPHKGTPKNLLANAFAKKTPIWYVVGGESDLRQLEQLPGGMKVTGANGSVNDVQADVDPDFQTFKLEPEEVQAIKRFPPMQVPFGEHAVKVSFATLLKQRIGSVETDYPLLSLGEQEDTRYAIMHGEGIWRWRIYDMVQNGSHDVTNELIGKVVQYLAVKEDKSRFRVTTQQQFNENERITFGAELYNDNYEAVNDPEAELRLTDEAGNTTPYTFSRLGEAYRLDAGVLSAGRYSYTASVELNGSILRAKGEFTVRSLLAEQVHLVADHVLLEAMSERSGGLMVGLNEIDRIASAIGEKKEVVARSTSRATLSDLIELKWIFFALLALLTIEWSLRRRNGAY